MAAATEEIQQAAGPVTDLVVKGMNCANCAQHVTQALQGVPGVISAQVSLERGRAKVRWEHGAAQNIPALTVAVAKAGYEAEPASQTAATEKPSLFARWRFTVIIGLTGTIPLMLGEWVFGWNGQAWFAWLSFGLALMVQILGGARFYLGAWRQLRAGGSNMDTLVALGSTAAFGYSAWMLFSGASGHLYFMEAAAIITLISTGHWMEERAGQYAEQSMRALFHLAPETARKRSADGAETEVPVASLQPDDAVVLRPGARVPTDGKMGEGNCSIDESMLTGESMPVEKSRDSLLYAGTMVLDGQAIMTVTGVGEATAVAHIIAAVQRAQTSRAHIQRLADKISNVFVPIVVAIAIAAGLWHGLAPAHADATVHFLARFLWMPHLPPGNLAAGIICAVAVLIVACPCAMGLATPVAIMAGTNAAARQGILIRDGVALEKAGRLTAVLADKTGTLTQGRPAVVESNELSGGDSSLKLAASLARGSTHPLSRAMANVSLESTPFSDWKEIRGSGIEGKFTGGLARLGSLRWLQGVGVDIVPGNSFAEKWTAQGATVLGFAIDSRLAAIFALRDEPKPGIREAVRQLADRGLKTYLVTGDNPRTAAALAAQAGIDPANIFADVRPEQKAGIVRQLQEKGERVAFVGDGINDAPAIEQADLGIAVSQASDVANEAADIILLKSDVQAIPGAIELAQATLRTVKQNLFWAFFYNAAAVPLAALGFLNPILCAAAMGLSDLVVIGNALRLRRFQPRK